MELFKMGLGIVQYYVYNENQIELDILCKKIEESIGEDSFSMIQSASSNWVGFGFYEDSDYFNYLHVINKTSKSITIGALIYDSDSLWLNLKMKESDLHDAVHVGRFEAGFEKAKGNLDLWQPLLKKGAMIEQLACAFESTPVFVEDALDDILQLFGMEKLFWNELLSNLLEEY